ncbi:hypothetical protein ACH0B5_15295 [Ureibacillus sp. 179-F W5.1 NHS]|uniref:hypothetical protein n=1 Tax=Ureibacillus sp. 179-F W5.1 NHS TaxID=3374297 RepID=UPI00387A2017
MIEKLFKAKFTTTGKTIEQLKAEYTDFLPSDEKLQALLEAYQNLDGVEVIVYERRFVGEENYGVFAWDESDKSIDDKIRDFIYQAEQDDMFGSYIDDREEFLADWESGNYSPSGSLVFEKSDIEIIEELKKGV